MKLSEHFNSMEFKCKCGKCLEEPSMHPTFIERLEDARRMAKVPFRINSGYRCPVRNSIVGGKEDSAHTKGYAADIATVTAQERYLILRSAMLAGFCRIGIYESFIHLDCDPALPQNVTWVGR